MERTTRTGVALAALFSLLALPAQQEPSTSPAYRLAQAKLAEARGDVAAARRTLEEALAKANDADKVVLRDALAALTPGNAAPAGDDSTIQKLLDDPVASARLRELLQQRGFAPAPAQDPVQRLIAVLDEGTPRVKTVEEAMGQLENLGALVVPPLLTTLPKVGPFGFVNAMKLLEKQNDPRIAPALLARANSDPAFAALVVEQSQSMTDAVRQALVTGLDETKMSPATQLQFADVMGSAPGMDERRHQLALRLADDPTVQRELGGELVRWHAPWATEVFTKLRASKDPAAAASATAQWISLQTNLDEAGALAAIKPLDPRYRWWVAREVTTRSKNWAKVALLGLGDGANNRQLHQDPWFLGVEWRYGGAEAAIALLEAAKTQPDLGKAVRGHVVAIVMSGWVVPSEQEAALAALGSPHLAMALPKDDEARALAAWQRLERSDRVSFVNKVVELERPWHGVVTAQLATAERFEDVQDEWLRRDWTGAPPEVGAALVALAERFPAMPTGYAERPQPTTSGPRNWTRSLVVACERTRNLPSEPILVPLVRAGNLYAWEVLGERDPNAALKIASAPNNRWHQGLPRLLGEHGTADDVPTLVQLLGWHRIGFDEIAQVRPFVMRHGLGNLALLRRLAALEDSSSRSLAKQIAARLEIAQLAEFLTILPELPLEVFEHAIQTLQSQVGTSHAPMLAQALATAAARDPISLRGVLTVLDLMTRSGSTECLPALRSALDNARLGDFRSKIAATMVSLPGREWPTMLRELLAHPDARVVGEALVAIRPGQDQELLAAATKALLANLHALGAVDGFFDGLEPEARAATASTVLQAPDFDQASIALACSALRALGSLKDSRFAADLAGGAQHGEPSVRMTAAEQLGRLFTREAAPFLLDLLKDDDKSVRDRAKQSLELLADYLDGRAKWDERLHRK